MAFNLSATLGYDKVMSNLDNREIQMISLDLIDENEKNFFQVNDVQDLKDSMEINGILQPLLLMPAGDRYRIIAGHRRRKAAFELASEGKSQFKEVPCIILPAMSEAMEWTTLIQTNTASRELSYPEKMKAAEQMKKMILQLREEGVHIPGKMRDILSEQLEISKTELARMAVIEKNLSDEWKKKLGDGDINAFCAYELAKCPVEDQTILLEELQSGVRSAMTQADVSDYRTRKKCASWIHETCSYAVGHWASELRSKGENVPCRGYNDVLKHKEKGHPEKCCGCCGECPDVMKCKDACPYGKSHVESQQRKKKTAAEIVMKKNLFANTKYPDVVQRLVDAIDETGMTMDEIIEEQMYKADEIGRPCCFFSASELKEFMSADTISGLPIGLLDLDILCQTLNITPNWLLGFRGAGNYSGWNKYSERKPRLNQRVVVRRETNGTVCCGEYIYRAGLWFNTGLDDFPMNITGVTHWIECPEV